jgi:hypothetical protein
LIDLWIQENPDKRWNEWVVLAVDTFVSQPMIIVSEDGTVDGLDQVFKIDPDLFDQYSQQAQISVSSLKNHWNQVYSALSVSQLQSLKPNFHSGVLWAIPTINKKETSEIMSLLFSLKCRFETELHFDVCSAFSDGDSCFNDLDHYFLCVAYMPFEVIHHSLPKCQCVSSSFLGHFIS